MTNKRCGNCAYIGAREGQYLKMPNGEIQFYHFCENPKSNFKVCIRTATGCKYWEKDGEQT